MKLKNFLIRFLICLPFIATVLYVHSYNGELINNTKVQWQYLKGGGGRIYLALDVYAPSGIKISGIFSENAEITDCWHLVNYPGWYKGKENFEDLDEFQGVLRPYLPYNNDFDVLYTTGRYTFLYEWAPKTSISIPPENSIRIKYQNIGTGNYYSGKFVSGMRVISRVAESIVNGPIINLQILYPNSYALENFAGNKPEVVLNNLVSLDNSSNYTLKKSNINDYGISIKDEHGNVVDSLKGFICRDSENVSHVYFKTDELQGSSRKNVSIDFTEVFRHLAAVIFMIYFVLICRNAGLLFVRWRGIVLDGYLERLVIPTFLGVVFLTYLFFLVGILKLLYFQLIFILLLIILFFGFESDFLNFKSSLAVQFGKLKNSPWRIIFLALLVFMLFYNLSYCFVPATYVDGSGDIVNSYLPNLNDYIISHSFKASFWNSTNGIGSQAVDVLRAVAMIFIGEPGVYLLSFVYLLLILGGIYLIGKKIFNINNMLLYLALLIFLSGNLFTEALHFGKFYTSVLSFLFISLFSSRFSDHYRNYILPALFFAFLTSQYVFFIVAALTYYLFVFIYSFYKHKTVKAPIFKLHLKSLTVFCVLSFIFNLKLILEVGTFAVPGLAPVWISDFFLRLNQNNDLYRYIDNNYIRHFYNYHMLAVDGYKANFLKSLGLTIISVSSIDYAFIFLFAPFLRLNKYKALYVFETVVIVLLVGFFFPTGNSRVRIYFIYPLVVLQIAIINGFVVNFIRNRYFTPERLDVVFTFDDLRAKLSTVPSIGQLLRMISNAKKKDVLIKYKDFKLSLGQVLRINPKVVFLMLLILALPYIVFERSATNIEVRKFNWVNHMHLSLDHRTLWYNQPWSWFSRKVFPVFLGMKFKYDYLRAGDAHKNFDHSMLIRQYSGVADKILIIPVRFHSHAMRHITARHALGSVIYQEDVEKIMADLKKLNINYLSYIPMHYNDYNPFYTPVFESDTFYKYFKLLFSSNGRKFYKIIHNGTNTEYTPVPYNMEDWPFIPMLKSEPTDQ